jgi:hypothetical protein
VIAPKPDPDGNDEAAPVEPAAEASADEVAPQPLSEHRPAEDEPAEPPVEPWWQK